MESLGLQPYDVVMLVVVVGATLFGFWKGMAWQLASLASIVVSALVASRLGPKLAARLGGEEPWHPYVTMLVLFLATSLAIWLLFRLVAGAIDRVRLREFDRQIGALFGLAKGILLCVVITFFVVTLSEQARQVVLKAQSGRFIALLIKNATPVLPKEVTEPLGKYIEELDRKLDPNTPPDERPLADWLDPTKSAKPNAPSADTALDDLGESLQRTTDRAHDEAKDRLDRLRGQVDAQLEDLRKKANRKLVPLEKES